jgi:lipopolysaccharide transport system ATP-binding protein
MSEIAIKFENISKQYRLGSIGTGTLSHDLKRWWAVKVRGMEDPYLKINQVTDNDSKAGNDYVWALQDINFEVKQGEVLGIIGKNGAGKSTLLKILSRVTTPTTGQIMARGRIASLLEVGTGFHPEMTGRENIYMNGSIMGMTKLEIKKKFDEIVDFAGVGRYIDTPVKRYSSGMTVRLGFAIAAHLEPEILIVDEVLAVGDAEFQKKAIGKMHDVSQYQGRTVLFVSHNMTAIEQLCSGVMLIDKGKILLTGNTVDVINAYLKTNTIVSGQIIDAMKICNNQIMVESITINESVSNMIEISPKENKLIIKITGEIAEERRMAIEVRFFDQYDHLQMLFSPGHLYGQIKLYKKGNFEMNETIILPDMLTKNEFRLTVDITQPNIEILVSFPNSVKVICKGIQGHTGLEFPATNCGLLMLK